MEQKRFLIQDYARGRFTKAELARRYGVSRKTVIKWIERFEAHGATGLQDRSRRPHASPAQTSEEITEQILELRRRHPHWGAKKLLWILEQRQPDVAGALDGVRSAQAQRHGPEEDSTTISGACRPTDDADERTE